MVCAMMLMSAAAQQSDSTGQANRRTALRCLSSASSYASRQNWAAAISQAELGLSYDDTISDLWYVRAVAENGSGGTKAAVQALVKRALDGGNWVDYNRDNARILYADMLADTTHYGEVFSVLDASPFIYSSDAEYIRAKAYYRLGDLQSVARARTKIAGARRMYPSDTRFPLLFFTYENPASEEAAVVQLSSYFISQIAQYAEAAPDKDAELEIYAARYATGSTREKLLQSFNARGLSHPLYAEVALAAGLMTEKEAFEYIVTFADDSIAYEQLVALLRRITDEAVRAEAGEYFKAYNGSLTRDMNGDGIADLTVAYRRGRPQTVTYDGNQDGISEWTVECDFGVPVSGTVKNNNGSADFTWQHFPYLTTYTFKDINGAVQNDYELVQEELKWTPLRMEEDVAITAKSGTQFFFPSLNIRERELTKDALVAASANFTVRTEERAGGYITVRVLNGRMQSADYYAGGRLYAHAQFKDNIPRLRMVDADGDGIFETTEYYEADEKLESNVHSEEDERAITANLFGTPSNGMPFYLRMVQVDLNADTVPDFVEEYLEGGGHVASWDTDGDGNWNMKSIVYAKDSDGNAVEEDMFYDIPSHNVVSVRTVNELPVAVTSNGKELPVRKDLYYNFYWIGELGASSLAGQALKLFESNPVQGSSAIVESGKDRVHAVHIGDFYYGKIIPQSADLKGEGDEKENSR